MMATIEKPLNAGVLSLWRGWVVQSMSGIADQVASSHRCTIDDLKGPDRFREVVWARQEAMWRMRKTGRFTYPQIGKFLNRDHATIIHGVRAYERRLEALGK
jgi:chromosomal replication initiation ATPase DnaA